MSGAPQPPMRNLTSLLLITATLLVGVSPLAAQQTRVSPHETISSVVGGNRVTIVYGRPYSKDSKTGEIRKIWGALVPYDQVWRTGSDEATLLITQQTIEIGGVEIPAGAYTLWTFPAKDGSAKLAVNKQIGQWGINPRDPKQAYDEAKDIVRVEMKKDPLEKSVDQFTMALDRTGVIKMMWENTQYSVPFTVKK
jgi:hypothetical protein